MPDDKTHAQQFQEIAAELGPLYADAQKAQAAIEDVLKRGGILTQKLAALALDAISAELEQPDPEPEPTPEPSEPDPPSDGFKVPATPVAALHEGHPESYLEDFQAVRSVTVSTGMDIATVRALVLSAECNKPGSRIALKGDDQKPVLDYLQLGHPGGINGPDGEPLRDVEIVGEGGAAVQGIALQARKDNATGCGNNVRLIDIEARPSPAGWCVLTAKGSERAGAHLVAKGLTVRATPGSGFAGTGGKWGVLANGTRLTLEQYDVASAFQEHGLYSHDHQGGVYVKHAANFRSTFEHPATGKPMHVGCGRTLFQFVSRANEGPMPWGDILLHDILASGCGWEGLHEHIDADGNLDPAYKYSAGGGSALTFAGIVRGRVRVTSYEGAGNFCSELAVWPEQAKEGTGNLELLPTPLNPDRIRTYLTDFEGQPFSPIAEQQPAEGYTVTDLELADWDIQRPKATRQAFLFDAARDTTFERVYVNGRRILVPDPEIRTDYYPWATPCKKIGAS